MAVVQTKRKLTAADPEYDAGLDKYEIKDTCTNEQKVITTIAQVDSSIAELQAKKAAIIAELDAQIAALQTKKTALLAL
jgi:hypothetical protein